MPDRYPFPAEIVCEVFDKGGFLVWKTHNDVV